MAASRGNLRVRTITLPDNATDKVWPTNIDVQGIALPANLSFDEVYGMIIHSRNGFDIRVGFESGGITANNYFTIGAGLYLSIGTDQSVKNIYFRSTNAAGDVVEILVSDTLIGISVGPQ